MANNISVSFVANVADLVAKRAILSAELKTATADLNAFAKSAASSGSTTELSTQMLAAATSVSKLKGQISGVDTQLKGVGTAARATAQGGLTDIATSADRAANAMVALGRAVLAGFAVREVVNFAQGIADTAEQTYHAAITFGLTTDEVQKLKAEAAGAGVPFDAVTTSMMRLDRAMLTAKEGSKNAQAAFKAISVDINSSMTQTQLFSSVMEHFGDTAAGPAKVALEMALFGRNIQEIAPLLALTKEQQDELNATIDEYGAVSSDATANGMALADQMNTHKIAMMGLGNVMTSALAPALTEVTSEINGLVLQFIQSYKEGGMAREVMEFLASQIRLTAVDVINTTAEFQTFFVHIKAGLADLGDDFTLMADVARDSFDAIKADAVSAGKAILDAMGGDILGAEAEIQSGAGRVAASLHQIGSDNAIANFNVALRTTKENLEASAIAARAAAADVKALTGSGGRGVRLPAEGTGTTGDDPTGGSRKTAGAKGQGEEWTDELRKQELEAIQAGQGSADQLTQIEVNFWTQKVAAAKAGSAQYRSALANLEAAEIEAAKQAAEQKKKLAEQNQQIGKSDIDTQLAIEKTGIEDRRAAIEDEYRTKAISAQQEHDLLAQLLQEETQDEIKALEARKALYPQDVVAAAEADNQEREFRAKLVADLDALDRQRTADLAAEQAKRVEAAKKAAEEERAAWKTANSEILGDEKTLIDGILAGKTSLGQLLGQIALQTAEKELTADVQYFTERALLEAEGISTTEAKEQGGLLIHLLTTQRAVAATAVGEVAKTGATATGVAARTSAETTGAALTRSIWSLTNQKLIAADAAKAASGAYSALAGIPIIGPVLAPIGAAAAFAGVLAFGELASLDTGTNLVPSDMLAQIHQGERVIPAGDNRALMDAVSGGGGGGHTVNFGDFNVHGGPSGMSPDDFKRALNDHASHVAGAVASALRGGFKPSYSQPTNRL